MPSYLHPGVYMEEIPSGAKPIEGVSTSIAALIGGTTEGPIGEPVLVHSWDDYKARFGGIHSETDALAIAAFNFFLNGGRDAYVARLADNAKTAALPAGSLPGRSGGTATATNVLLLSATSAGAWGNALRVKATPAATGVRFKLEVFLHDSASNTDTLLESFATLSMDSSDPAYAPVVINGGSRYLRADLATELQNNPATYYLAGESISGDLSGLDWSTVLPTMSLTLNIDNLGPQTLTLGAAADGAYNTASDVTQAITAKVLALGSAYTGFACTFGGDNKLHLASGSKTAFSAVVVRPGPLATLLKLGTGNGGTELHGARDVVPRDNGLQALTLGSDGDAPTADTYASFFTRLAKVRDVNIVLLPGQTLDPSGAANPVIDQAITHCETTANRMLLVDPPAGTELDTAGKVQALSPPTSTYTALYYPWVRIANPFYNRDTHPTAPTTLLAAPSAFAAGIWARTDGTRGVWKAPAGVEATVRGMAGLEFQVEDGEQDQLNPEGVNCLRKLPSYGAVLWGTRTLSTKANPEWRYVPVRRTALYIESSIYNGIQWAVFEPNDHRLWSSLRANVGAFMDGLFRAGAFQGQKASDAYFVRCGLGDTMTQDDIDRGMVIAIVGFAPLKPAEFVIVRIQQKVGQS